MKTRSGSIHCRLRARYVPISALAVVFLSACAAPPTGAPQAAASRGGVALPNFINDPLEPINRGTWAFNEKLATNVLLPVGRVYRTAVPKPVRGSILDFTRNINYPGRLINHALQGRWAGAGDETKRFLCNTTVGLGGLFDVASKWNIPKSDAKFDQTLAKWGWRPSTFLVLPVLGPNDDRHAVGLAGDMAAEPWRYNEMTRLLSYVSATNEISERAEDATRIIQSEKDSYALMKYAWTYASKDTPPDLRLKGPIDVSSLQSLSAVSIACDDPEFAAKGRVLAVKIPATGRKLKCNYWLQPGNAPVVYISPGLASHRLSTSTLVVAENLYQHGYSVVTTTSVFHPEFMEQASSAQLPVYPPVDSHDLLSALTLIDHELVSKYPERLGKRALLGCSMGAFLTLRLAANEAHADPSLMRFDRYVAINPPVSLQFGAQCIDRYLDKPNAWPVAERQERVNNALHKAALAGLVAPGKQSAPMFDESEAKYLIGLSFRLSLRDIIFSSQTRHHMGIVKSPLSYWQREQAYQEIMNYSFHDYLQNFAMPYYRQRGVTIDQLRREGDLKNQESALRRQSAKIRVLTNDNDFLLRAEDKAWLRSMLPSQYLTVFPSGGHLGNMTSPEMRQGVVRAVQGM